MKQLVSLQRRPASPSSVCPPRRSPRPTAPRLAVGRPSHRLHQRRQRGPPLRSAEDDRQRRRPRDRQPDQPAQSRSPHLLAGDQRLAAEDRRKRGSSASRRNTSAKRSPIWHGVKGNGPVKINPVSRRRTAGAPLGSVTKTGDSWFTGEKPGTSFVAADRLRHLGRRDAGSTSSARSTPGCRARSTCCRAASDGRFAAVSPRLGRRAFLGALGGGALAALLPLRPALERGGPGRAAGARCRAPRSVPRPAADPRGAARGEAARSRSARRRCRSCPAAPTRMWTYGGTFPGPTIRRPAGHRTEVTFHHGLPGAGRRADASTCTAATTAASSTASRAA